MIPLLMTLVIWGTPVPDPNLPTLPPPLPTYITHDDGTRTTCTYDYSSCDWGNR